MRAIRVAAFGGPEMMRLAEVPVPEPGAGEIRVRVAAAGVGLWDSKERRGLITPADRLPIGLGWECSGTVERAGPGVSRYHEGDQILAYAEYRGCYAEQAICVAEWCAPKPRQLSMETAAALPVVSLTALQVLVEQLDIRPGERLLVAGAAGPTGFVAVQLAARMGARVFATSGPEHHEELLRVGVERVVDYRSPDLTGELARRIGPVEAVMDTVGSANVELLLPLVVDGGRVVGIAGVPVEGPAGVGVSSYYVHGDGDQLQTLAGMVAAGDLISAPVRTLPLSAASEAHRRLEQGTAGGKLVLIP